MSRKMRTIRHLHLHCHLPGSALEAEVTQKTGHTCWRKRTWPRRIRPLNRLSTMPLKRDSILRLSAKSELSHLRVFLRPKRTTWSSKQWCTSSSRLTMTQMPRMTRKCLAPWWRVQQTSKKQSTWCTAWRKMQVGGPNVMRILKNWKAPTKTPSTLGRTRRQRRSKSRSLTLRGSTQIQCRWWAMNKATTKKKMCWSPGKDLR